MGRHLARGNGPQDRRVPRYDRLLQPGIRWTVRIARRDLHRGTVAPTGIWNRGAGIRRPMVPRPRHAGPPPGGLDRQYERDTIVSARRFCTRRTALDDQASVTSHAAGYCQAPYGRELG